MESPLLANGNTTGTRSVCMLEGFSLLCSIFDKENKTHQKTSAAVIYALL